MLRQILHKSLKGRHSWRTASFNELNEIYLAMFVRGVSLSMTGLFTPIFLAKLGYSLTSILSLFTIYFIARVVCDILAGYLVAFLGPKHVMFIGQVIFAVSSALFLTLPTFGWPISLLGIVWGASQSCFFLSFDVDFSKIKHKSHGGTELSYAEIMSKLGAIAGPLLGGVVALLFGARYIFAVSTVLLLAGLLPLFKTREPVRTGQHLDFKGFPYKKTVKFMPSIVALHLENTISVMLWPLFLSLFVLHGDDVFIKVGLISALSMVLAIVATRSVGQLVDAGRGRQTLRISAISNALLHLVRPLVSGYTMAFGLDSANQVVTAGYRLPFLKAHYDHADELPGHRIVYVSLTESISSIVKALVYALLAILSLTISSKSVLTIAFFIASGASIIIATERFPSLRPKNSKNRA